MVIQMKKNIRTTVSEEIIMFDFLPPSAYVRLPTVMRLYGVSAATVWRLSGKTIPAPRKLSERVTAWNVGKLRDALSEKKEGQR